MPHLKGITYEICGFTYSDEVNNFVVLMNLVLSGVSAEKFSTAVKSLITVTEVYLGCNNNSHYLRKENWSSYKVCLFF